MNHNLANARNYSDDELKALDRKLLLAVSQYNGQATRSSPALRSLLEKKPLYRGDCLKAYAILHSADYKTTVHIRPDHYVSNHGGHTSFTTTTATHTDLAGKQVTRDNLPIPLPYGTDLKYDNLIAVTAFVCQFVKNDSGSWVSSVNSASWEKVYAAGIHPTGVQMVAGLVCDIFTSDPYWQALTPQARNSIQGPEKLSFAAVALNRLPELSYYSLNCNIVTHAIQAFDSRVINGQTVWIVLKDDKGNPIVPKAVWSSILPTESTKVLLQSFPGVLKFNGSLPLVLNFPLKKGQLKSALMAQQLLREVQGGDDACSAILSSMRGYSGMTDEFGRRIQFLIAATLSMWLDCTPVTIQLTTIGDLAVLMSSLNYWRREIVAKSVSYTEANEEEFSDVCDSMQVKFMLPGVSDRQKIVGKISEEIVTDPIEGSTVIMYNPGNLPSATEKGAAIDYENGSRNLFPPFCWTHDFIIYSTVYGDYPFPTDKEVLKNRRSSTALFRPLMRLIEEDGQQVEQVIPLSVFRHGVASSFRGVITTYDNLNIVGFGKIPVYNEKKELTGYDMSRPDILHNIPLVLVKTQAEWYNRVIMDCEGQATIFACPVMRYSGISNLVFQSKIAALLNLAIVPLEGGVSAGSIVVRNKVVQETVVDFTPEPSKPSSKNSVVDEISKSSTSSTTATMMPVASSTKSPIPLVVTPASNAVQQELQPVVNDVADDDLTFADFGQFSDDVLPQATPAELTALVTANVADM